MLSNVMATKAKKVGRPKNESTDEVRVPTTATILPWIVEELERIAIREDRTRSAVIERILIRGIVAYQKDGKLTEPGASSSARVTPKKQ